MNNIFALGFDCSCYSRSIILDFLYVYVDIVAPRSVSLDYFYLQKCAYRNLISYIFDMPTHYLNKISLPSLWPIWPL